ncbi:unnamed protein product [Cylicocyclus nassatus]|uniref:Uncharacterized protein n=1 Tax=Cylicocyclus nassatus TaxID=53992 RepID=A0AA36H9G5_CYLNA|nr:unnamed protein product [Cylicocyclus nassatus]
MQICSRKNISRVWHRDSSPPFKEFNMVEVMEKWQRPKRAHDHDHFLLVLDFMRHFFLNACEPPTKIQQYACRQSGKKGKFDHLKDLPEGLVDFLISFILDALGLHRDQLLRTPDEHKRNPNKWWEDLRRYHFDPDRAMLLPSKKKRVMVEGSTVTKEDEVIQKTEAVEDEVEVVED